MDETAINEHLSRIATVWSELARAHGPREEAAAAQQALLQRYCGAIYRYLVGAVRDPDAAAELCQEFALRFLRGDFKLTIAAVAARLVKNRLMDVLLWLRTVERRRFWAVLSKSCLLLAFSYWA
jgi:DNA-directed RNA polymerase specialized sigma24 family protein